jgi:hypothetical protein
MKTFEKPIILNGLAGRVVLVYGDFIIGNIPQDNVDLNIERINKDVFNPSEFDSIINVKDVVEYEFEIGSDSHIMFGLSEDGSTTYKTIDFQNVDVAKEAEKSIQHQFQQLGFKREEVQLTPLKAAVTPGVSTLAVAIGGAVLTWFAYDLQTRVITRTRVVKWYVYLFEKIAYAVGYIPLLVVTGILTLICLFWLVRRIANPPFKVSATK